MANNLKYTIDNPPNIKMEYVDVIKHADYIERIRLLDKWKETDKGRWVVKHTMTDIGYNICFDKTIPYMRIYAYFTEKNATFFKLKWG